jgi:F420H(2)-dependent quinone reductase
MFGGREGSRQRRVAEDLEERPAVGAAPAPLVHERTSPAAPWGSRCAVPIRESARFGEILAEELIEEQQAAGPQQQRRPVERTEGRVIQVGAALAGEHDLLWILRSRTCWAMLAHAQARDRGGSEADATVGSHGKATSTMDPIIAEALAIGPASTTPRRTVDITTTGARTGKRRRIEINFWHVNGRWYLANAPTPRSWFANLRANPHFTFHLKHGVNADLPATAVAVTDDATRRRVLGAIIDEAIAHGQLRPPVSLDDWVAQSPLVEIRFDHA